MSPIVQRAQPPANQPSPGQVSALSRSVTRLLTAITNVQRRQLQQAY
jgi:hypothetical protein